MRWMILGLAGVVAGCASVLAPALDASIGQPVASVFARIGPPDERVDMPSGATYVWRRSLDFNGNTHRCVVRVQTDSAERVVDYTWDGPCDDLVSMRPVR